MANQNDSVTVKKMKAEIAKKKQSKGTPLTTPEVVNGTVSEVVNEGSHTQPYTQPNEVVENTKNTVLDKSLRDMNVENELNNKESIRTVQYNLSDEQVQTLTSAGLTDTDITEGLTILADAYKAEGLTPKSQQLVDGLLQMHRDAR